MEHKFSIGKFPPEIQEFRLFRKISSGTNQKVEFHLHPNRNFQNFLEIGKRSEFPKERIGQKPFRQLTFLFNITDLFQQLCNTSDVWKQPVARITGSLRGMAAEFTKCSLQSADCCADRRCLAEFPIKLFVQHSYCLRVY